MKNIAYREGYKYQLAETYRGTVPICPPAPIRTEWLSLTPTGLLVIRRGYAWDGPSGPTWDTKTGMRGSLIHDALYQLLRQELLPPQFRAVADRVFYDTLREDGMWWARARYWWRGVRLGGGPSADPDNVRRIIYAPA